MATMIRTRTISVGAPTGLATRPVIVATHPSLMRMGRSSRTDCQAACPMMTGARPADPGTGDGPPLMMEGVFPKMTGTPGAVHHAGREMGADNAEIFEHRLGLSDEELAALKSDGVI